MRLNLVLTVIAAIAVVNGFRLHPAFPSRTAGRLGPVLAGAALPLVVAVILAAAADDILDWLNVSPESLRITAGTVLAVSAARTLVWPRAKAEPELGGAWVVLVPITFPLLLTPELAILALTVGADHGVGRVVLAVAIGLAVAVLVDLVPRRPVTETLMAWAARVAASALAIVAIALVIDGIRDI